MNELENAQRRIAERRIHDEHDAKHGYSTPLWNEAYDYADGSRDAMWDWLETEYLNLALMLSEHSATTPPSPTRTGD